MVDIETPVREPARSYYRQPQRLRPPPEPHQKYHIDPADYPPDCDTVWVPIKIKGMESGQLRQYIEGGWIPARACDFAEKSGYGTQYPDAVVRGNYIKQVQADDVVIIDDQMLFVRPREFSEQADQNRIADARDLVHTQMQRLKAASARQIGEGDRRTIVKYGQQFARVDDVLKSREGEV